MLNSLEPNRKPPSWLQWLGNDTTRAVSSENDEAPIGCHYFYDEDECVWEVTAFAGSTEIVGGPLDGTQFTPKISVDVRAIANLFDAQPEIRWRTAANPQPSAYISVEGLARGRVIWLRVLKDCPDEFGPGRLLHASNGHVETLWQ